MSALKKPQDFDSADTQALEAVRTRCSPSVRPEFFYRWDVVEGMPGEVRLRVTTMVGEPGVAQVISAEASGVIGGLVEDLLRQARAAFEHVQNTAWRWLR
jgi:hypothetical protein